MKAPEHLVALAESDEASVSATATIRENGMQVRKQAGRLVPNRYCSAYSLIKNACQQDGAF